MLDKNHDKIEWYRVFIYAVLLGTCIYLWILLVKAVWRFIF